MSIIAEIPLCLYLTMASLELQYPNQRKLLLTFTTTQQQIYDKEQTFMWLDNLKELKKEKNMSTKALALASNLPEKTVIRILSGATASPYLDTLDRLASALDSNIGEILAGTRAVVGDTTLAEMQAKIDELTAKNEEISAQLELATKDNAIQIDKVNVLTKELDLANLKLMYTEKLLATHEYYTKANKE